MALVIIGGGIIGLSIAYFTSLSQPQRKIIILDSEKSLFLSASGFSGGYIVRDWFSPSVLPLAEMSFRLHRELADAHDGQNQWGYCESTAFSLVMEEAGPDRNGIGTRKKVRGEDWLLHGTSRAEVANKYASVASTKIDRKESGKDDLLREDGSPVWANLPTHGTLEKISSASGCAQVEPKQLCEWLLKQCERRGVQVLLSTKTLGFARNTGGEIVGIRIERQLLHGPERMNLACKDVVIAAGCWSPRVFETLVGTNMNPSIRPLAGYSIVVRSPRYARSIRERSQRGEDVEMSHAIFYPPGPNWTYSPEAMARMTREGKPEIYAAGLNIESLALPTLAGETKNLIDRSQLEDLRRTAITLAGKPSGDSGPEDDLHLVREGLCFRPVSESGTPIISQVKNIRTNSGGGLYAASGHGPWGITLSLGTGFVVSEMLQGNDSHILAENFALKQDTSLLRSRL
jgi:glycine/D-amino acid oxidase-like deaminating enzyme